MSTPLLANNRIEMQYVVEGFLHKKRSYCEVGSTIAGIIQLGTRNGVDEVSWTLAAEYLAIIIEGYSYSQPGMLAVLQERSGSIWNPLAFHTCENPGASGSVALASMLTIVVRDTEFLKMRETFMEGTAGYVGHTLDGSGMGSGIATSALAYTSGDANEAAPFNWAKSRGDNFILEDGSLAGVTLDLNDKMKRARGLE